VPHVTVDETKFLGDAMEILVSLWTGQISGNLNFPDLVRVETDEILSSRLFCVQGEAR
jgi:hypothetical protein